MDTTPSRVTAPELAKTLGVSLPAAHHALDKVGVPRTGRGRVRTVDARTASTILASRGATPRSARTGAELRVLAALSFSPLGLRSFRAVAEKAGVSPTTASRLVTRLADEGYAVQREVKVASARARREKRWFADSTRWSPDVRAAVRATRLRHRSPRQSNLPPDLQYLFWNAEPSALDARKNGSYMAARLLTAPDIRAWQWALTNIPRDAVETAVSRRGVKDGTRALVQNWWNDVS